MSDDLVISNGVLTGRDGWLFLWNGNHRQFDHLLGEPINQQSVENFVQNLASRRAYSEQRGIRYAHIVSPSKPVIMNDFLPDNLSERIQSLYKSKYHAAVRDANLSDVCVYPDEELRRMRADQHVFRKADTHMSAFGSAVAVRKVLEKIGIRHNPLDHMREVPTRATGDLAAMLGLVEEVAERALVPIEPGITTVSNRDALKGNTGGMLIAHNPDSISSERLLLIGDSFNLLSIPHFSTYFRDILYVRSAQFQPDLADAYAPDVIISGNAERYLCMVNRDDAAKSILLSGYGALGYQPSPDFVAALQAQLAFRWYRKQYDQWIKKHTKFSLPILGKGRLNKMMHEDPDAVGTLVSTGRDPWIYFESPNLQEDIAYTLEIEMFSSVQATAQLFFSQGSEKPEFTEEFSVRHAVMVGENKLSFPIPESCKGRALRLDPLNCEGRIYFGTIQLVAPSAGPL